MWWKWFPWRFAVRDVARRQGFLDPIKIISQLQNFAQPAEVAAPKELLRSGVVLHARGLMNSLAIQHNLDWIWPYWVECQYDPLNEAFIPRSFSLTQINLTHRNWTALGVPDSTEFPIVDPHGLVTPLYDSWSIDTWIIPEEGEPLIPSRLSRSQPYKTGRAAEGVLRTGFRHASGAQPNISQKLIMSENLCVITESQSEGLKLYSKAQVIGTAQSPVCQIQITGYSTTKAKLIISLRPYNPEGVSFINTITFLENSLGWLVNGENFVYFDQAPERCAFSYYHHGDVFSRLSLAEDQNKTYCKVGMATAAALYALEPGQAREITVSVPLTKAKTEIKKNRSRLRNCEPTKEMTQSQDRDHFAALTITAQKAWEKSLTGVCALQIPDASFKFLYESALRTMVLHSPKEVYPGPFIYRRFWFRDAAFIIYALLCVGLKERARRALDCFRSRQTVHGYFFSQEGEWDSNGEALWIIRQYCEMTGKVPPNEWKESVQKAGRWICKKRLSPDLKFDHAGLLPAGFSAEHLGPNDFYYWDDFWAVAGLKAAAFLCAAYKNMDETIYFENESQSLLTSINQSLKKAEARLKRTAIPASPYRRMDTGAIGSLVASYPLRIFRNDDPRIVDTVDFLMKNCLVRGGFFHDMTHSGINPYLTLHIAQVLLRAGDPRYLDLMTAVANLATSTGQWPEAIHPRTGGGCMGDGQHVWAAAEWVLMIRNCFVREEGERLILCSGIPRIWLDTNQTMTFGPALTSFGDIQISIKRKGEDIAVDWHGQWFEKEPQIDIQFPGLMKVKVQPGTSSFELKDKVDK